MKIKALAISKIMRNARSSPVRLLKYHSAYSGETGGRTERVGDENLSAESG
jgi:hypothetical protein